MTGFGVFSVNNHQRLLSYIENKLFLFPILLSFQVNKLRDTLRFLADFV